MLVIGSQATAAGMAKLGIPYRTPVDLDFVGTEFEIHAFARENNLKLIPLGNYKYGIENAPTYGHIELEIASGSAIFYRQYTNYFKSAGFLKVYDWEHEIAPLEVMYSMKRAHRHYPRAWEKHILDYHAIKRVVGTDAMPLITHMRELETAEREGKLKTPSLNKKTTEFFDDNVSNKVFIHDEIHGIMAYREKPMFEYIKVSAEKVTCSKEKFFQLSLWDRYRCVLEEAYVIALERGLIPMMYSGGPFHTAEDSLKWALMRICTTLTSGWFRDFATENYPEILAFPITEKENYAKRFFRAVDEGRIKRINETVLATK